MFVDSSRKGMAMGSAKPWPEVMEVMTGKNQMDASAMLKYFAPLDKFLTDELDRLGECVGWGGETNNLNPNLLSIVDSQPITAIEIST
jgi:hypothetical protein